MTVEVDGFSDNDEAPQNHQLDEWFEGSCMLCQKPLRARYWVFMGKKTHPTVHDRCAADYQARNRAAGRKTEIVQIPERFAHWDPDKFTNLRAISEASVFDPDCKVKTLAIMGDPGRGKSRLMWNIVRQFFDIWEQQRHQSRWVEYFLFSDLMTEYDQSKITKVKLGQFVFLDDLGEAPAGRTRALVQEVVRFRCQAQKWTFLTIDSDKFDPDLLANVFKERAITVKIA